MVTTGSMKDIVRVAAIADLHYARTSQGLAQTLFAKLSDHADVLVICGDLTDYGLPEEAQLLAKELKASVAVPILAVLGNHDYESGKHDEVRDIFCDAGVTVMDGDAHEIYGVGFAGVKGFVGGFGRGTLGPWGEDAIKLFVREAVEEALKLEAGLARLRTDQRIAILHYSPIQATVEGEPVEIFPWLGTSRLEEPINRFGVTAVLHGHAHHGTPEGRTRADIAVYNVSLPLLQRQFPHQPPYRVLEIPVRSDDQQPVAMGALRSYGE